MRQDLHDSESALGNNPGRNCSELSNILKECSQIDFCLPEYIRQGSRGNSIVVGISYMQLSSNHLKVGSGLPCLSEAQLPQNFGYRNALTDPSVISQIYLDMKSISTDRLQEI